MAYKQWIAMPKCSQLRDAKGKATAFAYRWNCLPVQGGTICVCPNGQLPFVQLPCPIAVPAAYSLHNICP